jgi:hypothetical protein
VAGRQHVVVVRRSCGSGRPPRRAGACFRPAASCARRPRTTSNVHQGDRQHHGHVIGDPPRHGSTGAWIGNGLLSARASIPSIGIGIESGMPPAINCRSRMAHGMAAGPGRRHATSYASRPILGVRSIECARAWANALLRHRRPYSYGRGMASRDPGLRRHKCTSGSVEDPAGTPVHHAPRHQSSIDRRVYATAVKNGPVPFAAQVSMMCCGEVLISNPEIIRTCYTKHWPLVV